MQTAGLREICWRPMILRSILIPYTELLHTRELAARYGFHHSDGIHVSATEYTADLGPIVRIARVDGLPAVAQYTYSDGWIDELEQDLAAGLYSEDCRCS